MEQLYAESGDMRFGTDLLTDSLLLQLLVTVNRLARREDCRLEDRYRTSRTVSQVVEFINLHYSERLSLDRLAETFYVSKYYMMRLFKQETGYTIGTYIAQKRLLLAKELLLSGVPSTQVCFDCGYKDYSTFSRAYRKLFGESPRDTLTLA